MWTIIHPDNYEKYLKQHGTLRKYSDEIKLYETNDKIILPRQFYKNYPSEYLINHKNSKFIPDKIQFNFTKELRPEQKDILSNIQSIYDNQNYVNGIIHARPGLGKTVLAIYIASLLGFKTIFLMDNKKLVQQWVEEILSFTDLTEDDIGKIYSTEKFELNKKIYIGLVQTFNSKIKNNILEFYNIINQLNIGFVVFDECHKTTAGVEYSKTSLVFDTPNIIGLSATPYASYLHEILLHNSIGPVIAKNKNYELIPIINYYFYTSNLADKSKNVINYLYNQDMKIAKAKYNSEIANDENYLTSIYQIIKEIQTDKENDRRIIIICFTEKQMIAIQNCLNNNNIESKLFYAKQTEVDKDNDKLLIATYAYASHGFNYKELTDIILACPLEGKKSLIQCIGRILRSCFNKSIANVYDLMDANVPLMFTKKINMKTSLLRDEFGDCIVKSIGNVNLD